jgi:hypothetical protein
MGGKLKGTLVPVPALGPAQRETMFRLLERYYENVTRADFLADLAEKPWVIVLSDPRSGELCGFSTQMLMRAVVGGADVSALFSGDTIVAQEHWGDIALARTWGRLALSLIDRHESEESETRPGSPCHGLYWFLISKGYKTYRFLPLFFHEFFPRCDVPTPGWACRLIDGLGSRKYPQAYDPARGVIRAGPRKDRLRPGIADPTPQRLRDPHVRYFVERNPGYVRGEELCCLAPLSRANFTAAAYRAIGWEPVVRRVTTSWW